MSEIILVIPYCIYLFIIIIFLTGEVAGFFRMVPVKSYDSLKSDFMSWCFYVDP